MAEDDAGGSCEDSIDFIVNTAPTSPTVYLSPNNPDTTIDITAHSSGSIDADGDSVSYQYAWMVNGATTNVLTDTFPNNLTTKGDQITVSVTPHDGISNGTLAKAAQASSMPHQRFKTINCLTVPQSWEILLSAPRTPQTQIQSTY